VVATPRAYELPSTGSVRHELKLFRQALKAYAGRDDARRERIGAYVVTHPVVCIELPSPGEPRKRRINDQELTRILAKGCGNYKSTVLGWMVMSHQFNSVDRSSRYSRSLFSLPHSLTPFS